jgi:uncharacterized protein YndB with AHSA1/START domain
MTVAHVFDGPVARVWEAWTDADRLRRWWGPRDWTCPTARLDVREGGASLVAMRSPDGHEIHHLWEHRTVAPCEELTFDQHFADPDGNPVDPADLGLPPGIPSPVHHRLTFAETTGIQLLTGEADVHLTRSDLANNAIVGGIYDAMRLHIGRDQPTGAGRAQLRLEQGVLNLTNFYYNNRGVELRASGRALDIFRAGDSPIEGYAVGSARPLRELKLPFFAEADDILNALQKSVTTFHVTGLLAKPNLQSAGFSEITHDLRGFILGELTSEEAQRAAH